MYFDRSFKNSRNIRCYELRCCSYCEYSSTAQGKKSNTLFFFAVAGSAFGGYVAAAVETAYRGQSSLPRCVRGNRSSEAKKHSSTKSGVEAAPAKKTLPSPHHCRRTHSDTYSGEVVMLMAVGAKVVVIIAARVEVRENPICRRRPVCSIGPFTSRSLKKKQTRQEAPLEINAFQAANQLSNSSKLTRCGPFSNDYRTFEHQTGASRR